MRLFKNSFLKKLENMKSEEIKKMEQEVAYLKAELLKYQKMFETDGHVDTEEQRQLDSMQATIRQVEQKIAEKKVGGDTAPVQSNTAPSSSDKSFDDLMQQLKGYVSSIEQFVNKWEGKINNNSNIA